MEIFVDVILSTTHTLRVFWEVLPRALGRDLHYKVGALPLQEMKMGCL